MPKQKSMGTMGMITIASTMGLHMVSGVIIGAGLGWLFDNYFETKPLGSLIFIILGVLAGFMNVWRDMQRLMREQKSYDERQNENSSKTNKP